MRLNLLAVAVVGIFAASTYAAVNSITYRSSVTTAGWAPVDQNGQSMGTVGGLSGITYAGWDAAANSYAFWAVQDNSNKAIKIGVRFDASGNISSTSVLAGVSLAHSRSYEGIVLVDANTAYFSEEDTPAIHQYNLATGQLNHTLSTHSNFFGAGGIVANYGFEALARYGNTMWTANEARLKHDGGVGSPGDLSGTSYRLRLQRYENGELAGQYRYDTSAIHSAGGISGGVIGLVDLVALPDGSLLSLERSAAKNVLNNSSSIRSRIFQIYPDGATDITSLDNLASATSAVLKSSALYDAFVFDSNGENLEGLALGPQIGPNKWVLLGVVDDGDGLGLSTSRLVSFELNGMIPEPAGTSLLLILASAGLLRRRASR